MSLHIPPEIKQVYAERQAENAAKRERYRLQLLEQHEDLKSLAARYRRLGAAYSLASMQGRPEEAEEDKRKLAAVEQELEAAYRYYEESGLSPEERYYCPDCQDTGIYQGELCHCALAIRQELERTRGIAFPAPRDADLAAFCAELFSPELSSEAYSGKASPRQVALNFLCKARHIVENFPDKSQSLYFFGKPGTGKTWLAAAIANGLRERGFSTAFVRAMDFVDLSANKRILERSFNPDPAEKQVSRERMAFIFNADVLILDDLGSETRSEASYNDLIKLLDSRVSQQEAGQAKLTIITGNLSPQDFSHHYDERLGSRLVGNYALFPFEGADLRIELARLRGKSPSAEASRT